MSDHLGAGANHEAGDPTGGIDFNAIFADGQLPSAESIATTAYAYSAQQIGSMVLVKGLNGVYIQPSWHHDGQLGAEFTLPVPSRDGRHLLRIVGASEGGDPDDYKDDLAAFEDNPDIDMGGVEIVNGRVKISSHEFFIESTVPPEGRAAVFERAEKDLLQEIQIFQNNLKTLRKGVDLVVEAEAEDEGSESGLDEDAVGVNTMSDDDIRTLRIGGLLERIDDHERVLRAIRNPDLKDYFIIKRGTRMQYETDGQYEATGETEGYISHELETYETIETRTGFVEWTAEIQDDEVPTLNDHDSHDEEVEPRTLPEFTYPDSALDALVLAGNILIEAGAQDVGRLMLTNLSQIRANPIED